MECYRLRRCYQHISRSNRLGLNRRKQMKIGTWNCRGLSFTTREMCRDLQYDILVVTETHNKGTLNSSTNFVTSDPAPASDPFSGVAIMLSDRVAKCVSHSGCVGSRIVYMQQSRQSRATYSSSVFTCHTRCVRRNHYQQTRYHSLNVFLPKFIRTHASFCLGT